MNISFHFGEAMYFGEITLPRSRLFMTLVKVITIKLCYDLCIGNLLRIERKHDVFLVYTGKRYK